MLHGEGSAAETVSSLNARVTQECNIYLVKRYGGAQSSLTFMWNYYFSNLPIKHWLRTSRHPTFSKTIGGLLTVADGLQPAFDAVWPPGPYLYLAQRSATVPGDSCSEICDVFNLRSHAARTAPDRE